MQVVSVSYIAFRSNPRHDIPMNNDDTHDYPANPKPLKSGFMARLRRYLLTGIVVTAPISITVYLTYIFLTFVDKHVARIIPEALHQEYYSGSAIPGLGLIVAVMFFIIIGWFATNFMGRFIIRLYEYVLDRMPVISKVYGAIKQIFETIMASQSSAFREAVMLEYPRKGVWSIGFVTGTTEGEVQEATAQETINVFVPTTPNPTSGYLLFVPKKELKYLDMTVEEAVKLVVSAGIITPPEPKKKPKPKAKPKTASKAKPKKS